MRNVFVTVLMFVAIGACLMFAGSAPDSLRKEPRAAVLEHSVRPDSPDAVAERYFFRGDYEPAVRFYRIVVADQPENSLAWARLAFATHELGTYEAAAELHEQAARFEENRAASLFKLGCALSQLGRIDEAIAAIDRAVEAGYGDRVRAEQQEDLEPLHGDERFQLLLDRMEPPSPGNGPLDFWAGNWTLRDPDRGDRLGYTIVLRVEDGHLFAEQWSMFDGHSGRSMTYLDPSDGVWKMLRVDNRGEIQRLEGEVQNGALILSGERIQSSGRISAAQFFLEAQTDGRILQTIRDADNDEAAWKPRLKYLLTYDTPSSLIRPRR